jgi:hypothetical protein
VISKKWLVNIMLFAFLYTYKNLRIFRNHTLDVGIMHQPRI